MTRSAAVNLKELMLTVQQQKVTKERVRRVSWLFVADNYRMVS